MRFSLQSGEERRVHARQGHVSVTPMSDTLVVAWYHDARGCDVSVRKVTVLLMGVTPAFVARGHTNPHDDSTII
jgi:hypothetical protein